MKFSYLLIDFFTILIPFIFSFHPRIRFHRQWKYYLPACFACAILFIIWDSVFTSWGIWWFNDNYLMGTRFFRLPIEEILFFICIPYACVFTYFCLDKFYKLQWKEKKEWYFVIIFSLFFLITGAVFLDRIYTATTFISTAFLVFFLKWNLKVRWIGKTVYVYALLLIPFLIVNGLLTGTGLEPPIVNYNNEENIGIRILTIPVEDAVYGYELFLVNIYLFKWFQSRNRKAAFRT